MQFRVPKFLEREATIAFGLTFKKLAVIGGLGLILFLLYYILPKIIFFGLAFLSTGAVAALMFIKIQNQTLFRVLARSFRFLFSPRLYFWSKGSGAQQPFKIIKRKKAEKKEVSSLKLAPRSRLHDVRSKIDLVRL